MGTCERVAAAIPATIPDVNSIAVCFNVVMFLFDSSDMLRRISSFIHSCTVNWPNANGILVDEIKSQRNIYLFKQDWYKARIESPDDSVFPKNSQESGG
jgi:hypothetical protein